MTGVTFTVLGILNLWEKNEKIKSTINCVVKFTKTNKPNKEYEIPYKERKVKNKIGDKFPTIDMVILVV
jgi:hypothetical protein